MADRPILFSGAMVRALLEGRKTQTRRVIKPQPAPDLIEARIGADRLSFAPAALFGSETHKTLRRLYRPGDRLWVREQWGTYSDLSHLPPSALPRDCRIFYQPSTSYPAHDPFQSRIRASMHMPRWASRLTLIVTDVRVQRLQEISEEDAKAEGVHPAHEPNERLWEHYVPHGVAYRNLWDSLNADRGYGWDANPWVVALTFTVHRCNIDQMPRAA